MQMSFNLQTQANINSVIGTDNLIVPIGQNLTNPATDTKVPYPGALSYNLTDNFLYLGNGTVWTRVGVTPDYAYIYNLGNVTLDNNAAVTYDTTGILSSGILFTTGGSDITFVNAGVYSITFYEQLSSETNNQFVLSLNDTIVTNTYSNTSGIGVQNTGFAILTVAAGDLLNVINTAGVQVQFGASMDGDGHAIINASLLITRLA